MSQYSLNILHLFPDLLNLYGDKGNLSAMEKRLTWRGMEATITTCNQDESLEISGFDIIVLGGGSDKEQETVCHLLSEKKEQLSAYIEDSGVMLATCGGFEMLGTLGILDIRTEYQEKRLISAVILESEFSDLPICGFENHAGRTDIGDYTPLGKVLFGNGNDGESGYEGLVYKNLFATYLHGPLLPKNPGLCDEILLRALKKKYSDITELSSLDDTLETAANRYITDTFLNK